MKIWPEKYDLTYFRKFSGLAVFVFSFFWFYFPAEYVLIANHDNKLFITSFEYFYSFLDHPGGIIEYVGTFISQFLRFRFVGALIISGIITLSYFAICRMSFRVSDNKQIYIVGIITPVLLIGMQNHYPDQIFHSLGFIIVMLAILLIPEDKVKKRMFLLVSIPVIYFFCGGYLWIFCAIVLAENFIRYKRIDFKLVGLIIGYSAVLLVVVTKFIYLYPGNSLLFHPFPFSIEILLYIFILWILLLPGLMKASRRWKFLKTRWGFISGTILCVFAIFWILKFTYDKKNTEFFRIEKFAVREEWDKLLRYADRHPPTSLFGSFYTNIALANKGLLCYNLFNYPTQFGTKGLCFEWAYDENILKRGSDFFWTINYVNEAHHWAFESLTVHGFTRRNLKRLIQTELIRGNYKVAEKYILVLDHTLFDKRIADHYRTLLNNRDAIENDPELGPRIKMNIGLDFFADGLNQEKNLKSLLVNDPNNRPAFDYLMSLFLLEKRVDEIVEVLPYYLKLTNGEIPSLLEESILVYNARHRIGALQYNRVSSKTRLRYSKYNKTYLQHRNKKDAELALYPSYNNSFWFYLDFGSIPKP